MTLILYAHPFASYCWKALIALYENDTPFELRLVDFGDEASVAEFRSVWPLAKMPVLIDGGRTIVESTAIIDYLDHCYPAPSPLIPEDPLAAVEARMLDRIFDNYVMNPMQRIVVDRLRPADSRDPHGVDESRRQLETSYAWLERELAGRTWAAGEDFGLADCAAAPSLHYADRVQPLGGRFPALDAYRGRLAARPSFARVLEGAEPYAHLFPQET
jgi:glutathione S-transferase